MATKETPHPVEARSSRKGPSRLHNFTFLSPGWGPRLMLRCFRETPGESGERGGSPEDVPSPSKLQTISPEVAENVEAELPWNLRRRRASYKGESSKSFVGASGKEKKRFSVSLSLEEIEIDFLLINGKKPPKRPKKRPRHVQKQVDASFPGRWLSNVNPDLYKVE